MNTRLVIVRGEDECAKRNSEVGMAQDVTR